MPHEALFAQLNRGRRQNRDRQCSSERWCRWPIDHHQQCHWTRTSLKGCCQSKGRRWRWWWWWSRPPEVIPLHLQMATGMCRYFWVPESRFFANACPTSNFDKCVVCWFEELICVNYLKTTWGQWNSFLLLLLCFCLLTDHWSATVDLWAALFNTVRLKRYLEWKGKFSPVANTCCSALSLPKQSRSADS